MCRLWDILAAGVVVGALRVGPTGERRDHPTTWIPEFLRADDAAGRIVVRLDHPVADPYLEFAAARCRPNTLLAAGSDLKVVFALFPVVEPTEVTTANVLSLISAQRASGDHTVVRLIDGESGLSVRAIERRHIDWLAISPVAPVLVGTMQRDLAQVALVASCKRPGC